MRVGSNDSMSDLDERLTRLEMRVDQSIASESRLAAIEKQLAQFRPKPSGLRDWLQTLGPYLGSLVALFIGFAIKDSVTLAIQREQLDLEYVKQMRDLIQDFDNATTEPAANANAIGLAMYGRHAIAPLVERLKEGDVAQLAAERGLHLAVLNDPAGACPRLTALLQYSARRLTWQNAKTLVRVIGGGDCVPSEAVLQREAEALQVIGTDLSKLDAFAARFENSDTFDLEAAQSLRLEYERAVDRLRTRRSQLDAGETPWWRD